MTLQRSRTWESHVGAGSQREAAGRRGMKLRGNWNTNMSRPKPTMSIRLLWFCTSCSRDVNACLNGLGKKGNCTGQFLLSCVP